MTPVVKVIGFIAAFFLLVAVLPYFLRLIMLFATIIARIAAAATAVTADNTRLKARVAELETENTDLKTQLAGAASPAEVQETSDALEVVAAQLEAVAPPVTDETTPPAV